MGRIIQHSSQVYKFLKKTNLHTATIILSVVYSNKICVFFFLGAEVVNIVAALPPIYRYTVPIKSLSMILKCTSLNSGRLLGSEASVRCLGLS